MGTKSYPKDTPSCDDQDYLSTVSKFTADDFTSCHSVAVTRDAESAEAETTTHHLEGQEEPEESLDTVQIIEAGEEDQEKAGDEEVEQEEEPVVIRQCVRVEVSDSEEEEEEDEEEEEVPQEEQFRNNYRQVCSLTRLLFLYSF